MSPSAFNQQRLPTGDGHVLYVAQYGKPDAPAAIVLHGGPGSGTQPSVLEWFDLSRQRVVLFDQRGAGLSTPLGEITGNDSQHLVNDIETIREHLRIDRWMVVGGSWGATLALLYAGQHADRISSLILRGSFLASQREMQWFFQSLRALVPQGWSRLIQGWSKEQQQAVLSTLCEMLLRGSDEAAADAAVRWGQYENAVMQAMSGQLSTAPDTGSATTRTWAKYRLQAHYLSNHCFTSEEALLDIASRLSHLPVIMVHGTHDLVCPPENAERLLAALPSAQLRWVSRGGHTPADPGIAAALRAAVMDLIDQV